jgi:hypothetical protein
VIERIKPVDCSVVANKGGNDEQEKKDLPEWDIESSSGYDSTDPAQ